MAFSQLGWYLLDTPCRGPAVARLVRVIHKCPLGGFLMTRRRPRVDNPLNDFHASHPQGGEST
jgi:hypothetical protein